MVGVAQVVGQYWLFLLLPLAAALAIAAAALYMLKRGHRPPAEEEEVERAKERLSGMVRERTAFLERANEELARSEEKYRTIIENSNDMIWTLDSQANFTYFNRRAEELSGYRLEEWAGKSFAPLIPRADLPRVQKVFMETMAGKPATYEVSFYAKDGRLVALSVNTTPVYEAGKVVGTASFGQDITERKKAEELVKNYTNRLETEVKRRTAELSAEKDKVEALLAMKDEFIRNVSHELKTPLSVIIGNLILLKDLAPAGKEKEWSRMVELLERNAKRLGNSIDNVLELSIVSTEEAGRERVYLKDLLNGIYGQYAPIAELKGLKLTLDAVQAVVGGDAKMLRLAVANLVDNAIKFTEKGSVAIALKPADGTVSVSVRDTGSGISAKDQKRLFEKFFKADPSAPGTGIGLAIAKEIVNKHNGEIRVKSALGKGSTFEVILPRGVGK